MSDWRPSPQLRCLYSQRDKARNRYLISAAMSVAESSTHWKRIHAEEFRRWGRAWSVLANMTYDLEQLERGGKL